MLTESALMSLSLESTKKPSSLAITPSFPGSNLTVEYGRGIPSVLTILFFMKSCAVAEIEMSDNAKTIILFMATKLMNTEFKEKRSPQLF